MELVAKWHLLGKNCVFQLIYNLGLLIYIETFLIGGMGSPLLGETGSH